MAAKAKSNVKKKFFEVKAPLISSKINLYATLPEELEGKMVRIDLTRILKGKSFELKLLVKKEGEELIAEPRSLWLSGSFIRRMIRNGIDYVEDSFMVECKDAKVVVKPFLITRHKVSREVRKNLRNAARKHLENFVRIRTTKELFSEIMSGRVQKEMSQDLKKIYPLALCEIRVFEIL